MWLKRSIVESVNEVARIYYIGPRRLVCAARLDQFNQHALTRFCQFALVSEQQPQDDDIDQHQREELRRQ